MNRRDLLKRLPMLGLVPVLKVELPSVAAYPETYRGFKIKCSGWIFPQDIHMYFCHWVAMNPNPERMSVYASYPGATGKISPGMMFDTSLHHGQNYPGPWSTPAELESYKAEAYHRLIRYLDMVYEELTS